MEADTERQMQKMKTESRESATPRFQMYQATLQGNTVEKWMVALDRKYFKYFRTEDSQDLNV